MIKAVLHVHSTYSDGEFTLTELRDRFVAAGCGIVCMADHADAFDAQKVQRYIEECRALSSEEIVFIPGLEFGCARRMHIVGFGTTQLLDSDDPERAIAHIRSNNGVAVIAHPPNELFEWIERFDVLPDGVEGWNSKYDGRYAPRPATFALIGRLRQRAPALRAFYGQDLHWRTQFSGLFTMIDIDRRDRVAVLDALRAGRFSGAKGTQRLPSDGVLPDDLARTFARVNARSRRIRNAVKSLRRMAGRLADHVPPPVKAQLRRIF